MPDLMDANEVMAQLQDCGREMAGVWMKQAVKSAKDDTQMNNQIAALYFASVNILATHILNQREQNGTDPAEALHAMQVDIASELRQLDENGETEYVKPEGGQDGG